MLSNQLIYTILRDSFGMSSEVFDAVVNWHCLHKDGSLEFAHQITDSAKQDPVTHRWHVQNRMGSTNFTEIEPQVRDEEYNTWSSCD
jgi:hypothetical protein